MAKIDMRDSNTASAVFISLLGSFVSPFIFCLFLHHSINILQRRFSLFALRGIMGPFFGRFLLFKGIDRVGAAISTTLYENNPLFTAIGAIAFLPFFVSLLSSLSTFFVLILTTLFLRKLEKVTWKIVLGAVLMVGATVILTTRT